MAEGVLRRDALRELTALLAPAWAFLAPMLGRIRRERNESRCMHSASTLVWTVLLGFLRHCHSRNRMDARRMEGAYGADILALSGQRLAPGARARAACTGTAMLFLRALDPAALSLLQMLLLERLLRAKTLRGGKLLGLTCNAPPWDRAASSCAGFSHLLESRAMPPINQTAMSQDVPKRYRKPGFRHDGLLVAERVKCNSKTRSDRSVPGMLRRALELSS